MTIVTKSNRSFVQATEATQWTELLVVLSIAWQSVSS